jgi:hypothetical protein
MHVLLVRAVGIKTSVPAPGLLTKTISTFVFSKSDKDKLYVLRLVLRATIHRNASPCSSFCRGFNEWTETKALTSPTCLGASLEV